MNTAIERALHHVSTPIKMELAAIDRVDVEKIRWLSLSPVEATQTHWWYAAPYVRSHRDDMVNRMNTICDGLRSRMMIRTVKGPRR